MKNISIDIETFSDVDLSSCGMYKYAQSPAFEILLFAYAIDGGVVQIVDIACGEQVPIEILKALSDLKVTKWAFHAAFERVCLSEWLKRKYPEYFEGEYLNPKSWRCSMVWSAYMGLPLSL